MVGSEAIRCIYIVPRELTGQIKPHMVDERGGGGSSGGRTAGEESERISWPTQKPTLLMTLSAVISGCYLSWLPGAHLLRITNLHTLPSPRPSFSHLSFPPPSPRSPLPSACPCAMRITESGDLFRRAALSETERDTCIFEIYGSIKKFKRAQRPRDRFIPILNPRVNSGDV